LSFKVFVTLIIQRSLLPLAYINWVDRKLKEQGAKTGSSSTNKSTSGLFSSALFDDALLTRQKSPNNLPPLQTAFTCYASHFWFLGWLFPRILSHRLSGLWRPILLQTPLNGSITRLDQGLVSQCRPRHFCHVEQGAGPFVTLVSYG